MDAPGMDLKKRKLEENGVGVPGGPIPVAAAGPPMAGGQLQADAAPGGVLSAGEPITESNGAGVPSYLTLDDARLMVDHLSKEELADIVVNSSVRHHDVLEEVRKFADVDPTRRKIFVRGLGWDTNTHTLRTTFSEFGELEEAIAIMDKMTGKSRGFGFVTYKHMDGALNALKERSKRIDGRMAVCQLASDGAGSSQPAQDLALRKIYVGNVPMDWPVDRMLSIFSEYGEIEEGPLGLDKQVGKSRGFALFIYKSSESARRALEEPVKNIGGHQLFCKLASEGARQRFNMHGQPEMSDMGMGQPGNAGPPPANMPYGGPQYGGGPQGMMSQGVPYGQPANPAMNTGLNTALGHGMNPSMHPNVGGSYPNQPIAANPALPSPMNSSLGPVVNTQVGTPLMSSYSSHGAVDGYGQQTSAYGGQQSGYSSPVWFAVLPNSATNDSTLSRTAAASSSAIPRSTISSVFCSKDAAAGRSTINAVLRDVVEVPLLDMFGPC
ncbi:hypothetical protein GOP47_0000749 [Adiantum capillus-veneris]|uniref:RRM domain-containing protein n=1 Tax=Adiantum capillus-veneris TaxID=13818 RepID=A0A9D4ZTD0_ADICA|nr:hypothetical protein GOP47_0000749 [Adiantum capillus-veneris]